jgi:hypothetical protein
MQENSEKEAKTSTNSEFLGSNSENRWKQETEASYSVASRILGCLRLKAVLQRIPGIFTIFFLYLCFFGPIYTPILYAFYFTWYVVVTCIQLLYPTVELSFVRHLILISRQISYYALGCISTLFGARFAPCYLPTLRITPLLRIQTLIGDSSLKSSDKAAK